MIEIYKVRPTRELTQAETDRYIEVKTMALGYFEAQLIRHEADGTHYDAADLFSVADAAEADLLLASLQTEMPDVEFEIGAEKCENASKFNPLTI